MREEDGVVEISYSMTINNEQQRKINKKRNNRMGNKLNLYSKTIQFFRLVEMVQFVGYGWACWMYVECPLYILS